MSSVAYLWADEIMNGNEVYASVPVGLKKQVKKILIDAGCEDLVVEEE